MNIYKSVFIAHVVCLLQYSGSGSVEIKAMVQWSYSYCEGLSSYLSFSLYSILQLPSTLLIHYLLLPGDRNLAGKFNRK